MTEKINRPENLRDLGGIPCAGGRKIRPLRLLRSGQLVELSEQDKNTLSKDLGLSYIVDFRSLQEVEQFPDDELPGAEYVHIDLFKNLPAKAPGTDNMSFFDVPEETNKFMRSTYVLLVTDADAVNGYRRFIRTLLDERNGAVLFHCQAGKDRTGVAGAIILTILGASREAIFEDYLKTNIQRKKANRIIIDDLRQKGVPENRLESIELAMSVKSDYLETAYRKAEEVYGSFEGFLEKALGVDDELRDRLRAIYLA